MQSKERHWAPPVKDKKNFEGKIFLKNISRNVRQKDYKIYHVLFKKGANTKIHSHKTCQTLIATKGKGILVTFKKITAIPVENNI